MMRLFAYGVVAALLMAPASSFASEVNDTAPAPAPAPAPTQTTATANSADKTQAISKEALERWKNLSPAKQNELRKTLKRFKEAIAF